MTGGSSAIATSSCGGPTGSITTFALLAPGASVRAVCTDSADWYDALAIAYDMSVPNVGHLEVQRGGCCTVMPYFIGRIVELPVTTSQDYSLFRILKDFSNDLWKDQIESIMSRHGLLSFIIHPDYQDAERTRHAYRMLLDRLSGLREAGMCWITLPGDVERWWRQRSRLTLVQEGGQWRIEGPGKERARIAYAELDGDDLTLHSRAAGIVLVDSFSRRPDKLTGASELRLANFIDYFSIDDLDVEALDRRRYGRSRVCCVSDPACERPCRREQA